MTKGSEMDTNTLLCTYFIHAVILLHMQKPWQYFKLDYLLPYHF